MFREGLAAVLSPHGATKESIQLTVQSASIKVTAQIVLPDANSATSAAQALRETSIEELSLKIGQTIESMTDPTIVIFDAAPQGQGLSASGENAESSVFVTVIIFLIVFNITTCICCALKRNSWTMISSRRDFIALMQGLPTDAATCMHIILPCLLAPTMWVAFVACCFKGCFEAAGRAVFGGRAQVSPELDDMYEDEPIKPWKALKFANAFALKPEEPTPPEEPKATLKGLSASRLLAVQHAEDAERKKTEDAEQKVGSRFKKGLLTKKVSKAATPPPEQPAVKRVTGWSKFQAAMKIKARRDSHREATIGKSPRAKAKLDAGDSADAAGLDAPGWLDEDAELSESSDDEYEEEMQDFSAAAFPREQLVAMDTVVGDDGKVSLGLGLGFKFVQDDAAVKMQSHMRGKKAKGTKKKKEKEHKDKSDAATKVQSKARAKKAKKVKEDLHHEKVENDAAATLQAGVRGKKAKKEKAVLQQEKLENDSATTVQSAVRGKKAKKQKEKLAVLAQEKAEIGAANKLQGWLRVKTAMRLRAVLAHEKAEVDAATTVQAAVRGKKSKKQSSKLKQEKQENDAATTVQSGVRAKKAKSEKKLLTEEKALPTKEKKARAAAAGKIQEQVREHGAAKEAAKAEEQAALVAEEEARPEEEQEARKTAATKLQSKKRSQDAKTVVASKAEKAKEAKNPKVVKAKEAKKVKQEKGRAEQAEMKAQLAGKIAAVEKKLEENEQSAAATKVQSQIRVKKATSEKKLREKEKKDKEENAAATAVQSRVRQQQAKAERAVKAEQKEKKEQHDAASTVQSHMRAKKAKAQKAELKVKKAEDDAATMLQSQVRVREAKAQKAQLKQEKTESDAATLLQARARGHAAQKEKVARAKEKKDAEEDAAATALQSAIRVKEAKAQKAALKEGREQQNAAVALQSRARGHKAKAERKKLATERQAVIDKEQNAAATKVQARVRGHRAERQVLERRCAKVAAQEKAESEAAVLLQSTMRGRSAREQVGMLRYDRDAPEDEKRARAAAATRVAAAKRAQQARLERDRRLAMRKQREADRAEASKALQTLIRIRKARQQRKLMQEASELASMLGISKWAALWMLRSHDEPREAADAPAGDTPVSAPAPEPEGVWGRLTSGALPPAAAPAPDSVPPSDEGMEAEAEAAQAEAEFETLGGDLAQISDDAVGSEQGGLLASIFDEPAVDELGDDPSDPSAYLDELLAPIAAAPEYAAPPPRRRRNRHWRLLAANLPEAVEAMRRSLGMTVTIADDPGTTFARAAVMRQSQLRDFQKRNANYPHGPLPQPGDVPGPRRRSSPRSQDAQGRRPASRGVVQQVPGAITRQGSAMAASRSAASLLERPITADSAPQGLYATTGVGLCGQCLPQYGDTVASRPPRPPPPVSAWGFSDSDGGTGSSAHTATSNVRQQPSLDDGFTVDGADAPIPSRRPAASPSMPSMPQRRAANVAGARRRESPPRAAPSGGPQRQRRQLQRTDSNERLAPRGQRRPPRMPVAQGMLTAGAVESGFDVSEILARPSTSQGVERGIGREPTEPSTGPQRTLRTSNSQVELRRLNSGPSGEIRAGPSLLSDMPLPFDMSAVSGSMSPRGIVAPESRLSFAQRPSTATGIVAPGRVTPRPGSSGGGPPVPGGASFFRSSSSSSAMPFLQRPAPGADPGPAYGERPSRPQRPGPGGRRASGTSPPRTYQI